MLEDAGESSWLKRNTNDSTVLLIKKKKNLLSEGEKSLRNNHVINTTVIHLTFV